MTNLDKINYIDKYIKNMTLYVPDGTGDVWTSRFNDIIEAEISGNMSFKFKVDCEDLVFTCIEYAHYKGIPITDMARLIVNAYPNGKNSEPVGHMVGLFLDRKTNKVYYFGDTFGDVCEIYDRDHEPKLINYFNDKEDWINYNDFKFK